jgi:hypothetical protein
MKITILTTVNTTRSKQRAVDWLEDRDYDCLFLDLPIDQEEFIREIALGAGYTKVLRYMRNSGLIKEPEDVQFYRSYEPIFERLYKLNSEIYCYRDVMHHSFSREIMSELLIMTLRAKLSRINVEEWRKVIEEEVKFEMKCAKREGSFIAQKARKNNVCIDANEEVERYLKNKGYDVELIEINRSYKPLDVLKRRIREGMIYGEEISDETISKLVRDHIRFIDIIKEKNFEDAYQIWADYYSREIRNSFNP